ncbi:bifunctional DNA-formamidopyrimidine glycosylase/DNA-(apurinic or apyrimidinic site) lyase [Candidatus Microgenomates bacterium]|nr:bifunctional DNA-formamidopyrimidine glycosylase/DNA-(apurinic or apyrimidinic site) lyase [Candidatus Microgenomates bacterium]
MPELPEVETIRLVLQRKIIGLTIKKIQILSPKSFIGNPNQAEGQKVLKIERFAKLLLVTLEKNSLLFHLKMTGQLILEDGKRFIGGHPTEDMLGKMPNAHTRVIFSFSDRSKLYFNDQRKFGWIRVSDKIQDTSNKLFEKLGPEPLEKEFTWQILKNNLLNHKSQPVKVAIMDQSVVSGVGNIYSNEACFNASLDPRKKVNQLTDKEFKSLHRGVQKALRDGIRHGGSTRAHFRDPEGHKGYFLDYAYVYGLDNHPCKVCKTEIKKIQLAGRGTYYCQHCQK